MLHETCFDPSVVLSEAARRAAQSKDLFSGARSVEAKRGPSTALRSAQDDGVGCESPAADAGPLPLPPRMAQAERAFDVSAAKGGA